MDADRRVSSMGGEGRVQRLLKATTFLSVAVLSLALTGALTGCSPADEPTSQASAKGSAGASSAGSNADTSPDPSESSTPSPTTRAAIPALAGRIVYRVYADASESSGSLFAVDSDGGHQQRLTHGSANVLDEEANLSPDGKHLVFTHVADPETADEVIQVEKVDITAKGASKPTVLTKVDRSHDGFLPLTGEKAAYSPDGRYIAYVQRGGNIKYNQLENFSLMVMNADGTHRREIIALPPYSADLTGVTWSPDGQRLVFAKFNCSTSPKCARPTGGMALFTVNRDGSEQHQLTPWPIGAGGVPDSSANGDLIVFRAVKDEESGIGNFFTIQLDGTKLTQVTHFKDTVISHKVAFSPDGRWIVFAKAGDNGINQVTITKTDGTKLRQVTHTEQAASSPDWGPTPRR